jgi:hypothetical protein
MVALADRQKAIADDDLLAIAAAVCGDSATAASQS